MRAEQPTKLCKSRWKIRITVKPVKPPSPLVVITNHPKAVLSWLSRLFYVRCCSIFKCVKCFNFNIFCVSNLSNSVTVTELSSVRDRAAKSFYHL